LSELLALRINDMDFKASTVRVDESSDQRNNGKIGSCKNAAAYRTVLLHDLEGKESMRKLKQLLLGSLGAEELAFRRWELAGIKPAVIRQRMGHSSGRMTALCSGEIPLDQVRAAFSSKLLETMENEAEA
jgi:integrase